MPFVELWFRIAGDMYANMSRVAFRCMTQEQQVKFCMPFVEKVTIMHGYQTLQSIPNIPGC